MGVAGRFAAGTLLVATLVGVGAWALVTYVRQTSVPARTAAADGSGPQPDAQPGRRITATLHYVSEDGLRLVPVTREVPFGDTTAQQARYIIDAQLEPPPDRLLAAIPPGTTVRSVFVSADGQAFVDFSPELRSAHPGGSLNELFTVYTVVSTLTANLPALRSVQILIDGREVDTLAGHVDLRRPLPPSAYWLEPPRPESEPARDRP